MFHAIFGTHLEDLSILEAVTSTKQWLTRAQFGKSFIGMGKATTAIEFNLPKMMLVSKLSSDDVYRI
mgnify:CR=1 FL=1